MEHVTFDVRSRYFLALIVFPHYIVFIMEVFSKEVHF